MKAKAIKDLNQLNDGDLFVHVSEGITLIFEHINSIESDVKFLSDYNRKCGFNILNNILKEESAKFLILLDAIRCPRVPPNNFTKQLNRFNDHLAKGIYSLVYEFRSVDFKEIRGAIERECQEYYLDGPESFDWIFKNDILQTREEQIYVDYIESDEEHIWLTPKRYYHNDINGSTWYLVPDVFEVASALYHSGCTTPESLSCIADIWRPIDITDDLNWKQLEEINFKTLEELAKRGLLKTEERCIRTIVRKWLFPLHGLDIRIIKVDKNSLREIRDDKFFDLYY